MRKSKIVIGLGFGDEGKGLTTSYLCNTVKNPIVVRFNGGHQAGHTVVHEGERHVFSSLGSGTLQGVPTYWSKHCTVYPIAFVNELRALARKSAKGQTKRLIEDYNIDPLGFEEKPNFPTIYVHPLCPVTTPFDVRENQKLEDARRSVSNAHGSVGVGFGQTIKRHEEFYKLYAQDLMYPAVLRAKLENIASQYYSLQTKLKGVKETIDNFLEYAEIASKFMTIASEDVLKEHDIIFEGAQGVLLDQDFGFFPNVTRSNTTSKNALEIIDAIGTDEIEIWYVTRTYQTRHGNGFMTNEDQKPELINNEHETNVSHQYQGNFRTAKIDTQLLNYALQSEKTISNRKCSRNLVVTCMDQHEIDIFDLLRDLNTTFDNVLLSYGDSARDVKVANLERAAFHL